jgi:hypothetical protein
MSQVFRVVLFLALASPAFGDTTDRLARTVTPSPGAAIRVQVTIGQVQVRGWERPEVSVEIVRRAPDTSALARLPVTIDSTPEAVVVRAVQRDEGRDAAIRSDVVLRVPAAARIETVDLFEGSLALADLAGPCTARVERGAITGRNLGGAIRLETGIGQVTLEGAALARPDGLIRVRTFNGDVDVALAEAPAHARILALSMGGTIASDIPLTRRERWGPRWAEATIGDGGPLLSIDVVNGDIAIRVPR